GTTFSATTFDRSTPFAPRKSSGHEDLPLDGRIPRTDDWRRVRRCPVPCCTGGIAKFRAAAPLQRTVPLARLHSPDKPWTQNPRSTRPCHTGRPRPASIGFLLGYPELTDPMRAALCLSLGKGIERVRRCR